MSLKKILVPVHPNLTSTFAFANAMRFCRDIAFVHGYELEYRMIGNNSVAHQTVTQDDYEFALVPAVQSYGSWNISDEFSSFYDGSLNIPSFVVSFRDETDKTSSITGVTRNSSIGNHRLYYKEKEIHCRGNIVDLVPAFSEKITPIITENADGTGYMFMWRFDGENSPVYFDCSVNSTGSGTAFENHSLFPFMLQEAINRNEVSKPLRKCSSYWDLDDFPEDYNDIVEVGQVLATMGRGDMTMTFGYIPADTPSAGVASAIEAHSIVSDDDNTGRVYPIVHAPSDHMDDTKANVQSEMDANVTTLLGQGHTVYKEACPYWYYPNNRFTQDTMELQTGEVTRRADENGSTSQKGWGAKVLRSEGTLLNSGYPNNIPEPKPSLHDACYFMSMRVVGSRSALGGTLVPDSQAEIDKFVAMMSEWTVFGMYGGQPSYIHGDDILVDSTPNYGSGQRWLDKMVDLANLIPDVHYFTTPSILFHYPDLSGVEVLAKV